jgi:hypothetical protein
MVKAVIQGIVFVNI